MKRLFILLMAMCSFTFSYSQEVKDLMTSEERSYSNDTKDEAYSAPLSKLIGKKWYVNDNLYYIFNQNGTGAKVSEGISDIESKSYRYVIKETYRWKRQGTDLTLQWTTNLDVCQPIESSLSQLSPRVKDLVKKDCIRWQNRLREQRYKDSKYEICKLTNDILIITTTSGLMEDCWLVTKKKFDELVKNKELKEKQANDAKLKAAEEAKQKAAEEAKLKEEASTLNKKAYELAKEEKYEDAIATIDKAIEKRPNDPNYYDSKGEILLMKGDKNGAKEMWSKVISLDKNFAQYRSNLYKGLFENWKTLTPDFDKSLPFRIIRVKNTKAKYAFNCCVFFSTTPNDDSKKDTKYNINFSTMTIGDNQDQGARGNKEISSCTRSEGGWYLYMFSTNVYFRSIQKYALDCEVQVLIL